MTANTPIHRQQTTLSGKLTQLLLWFSVPLILIVAFLLVLLFRYNSQYNVILHNVATVSEFNQDFKEEIDLKMYYYVSGSRYSSGLPLEEVESAEQLARSLLSTTTEKESKTAIQSVLNLCGNLEDKILEIERTESYDERQEQLENNIYILTDLIQDYMYTYLYYEAARLDTLQTGMSSQMFRTMLAVSVVVAALLVLLLLQAFRFSRSITRPVSALCSRVEAIAQGDLAPRTPIAAQEYEIQTLSNGFEQMVDQLNLLLDRIREEQQQLRSAELALLQAQINPHFLYNTLDTIIWLVETQQNDQAVEMVGYLSTFFRSSLSKGQDVIALSEEENHIRSYLQIQQVRYRDIMDFTIDVPAELNDVRLPKLTLQPLVENALYHGIKLKRGQGHIRVTGHRDGTDLYLLVRDDGAGMTPERLQEVQNAIAYGDAIGFGLRTVHERLVLFFGSGYGLTVTSTLGSGTEVTVHIPLKKEESQ